MKFRWVVGKKSVSDIQERQFEKQSRDMSLGKRQDSVLLVSILSAVFSVAIIILLSVQILKRGGFFEQSLLRPLPDERLLVNIRDAKQQPEFLNAVLHQGQVFISQKGGAVHRYDPKTGLWNTDYPFNDGTLVDSNLVMLRSGCGSDIMSDRVAVCPDKETLWAVTEQQGLVRRLNGTWEVLIGDSVFQGANGSLINNDQLNSAAVSTDGTWLLAGTSAEGIGLYNLKTHNWVQLGADFLKKIPSPNIKHVVWFQDAFWVGTDLGLVEVSQKNGNFDAKLITELPIAVADLDISSENRLWVLGTVPCKNDNKLACNWLGKFQSIEQFDVLLYETNRYPDLDLANLIDAKWLGNRVVMSGKSGIVAYDPGDHSWSRLFSDPVELTLDFAADGNGFYFASSNKVGRFAPGEDVALSDLPDGPPQQLIFGDNGRLLILTVSGNVYTVKPGESVEPVFTGQETNIDPSSFKRAVPIGNLVIMIGNKGVLLHDVQARTYMDIGPDYLPRWFTDTGTQFISSGGNIFVISDRSSIYVIKEAQFSDPEFYKSKDFAALVPFPLTDKAKSWWRWEEQGMGVLTEKGQMLLVSPAGVTDQTGVTPDTLAAGTIADVAELPEQLAFATQNGIGYYNTSRRSWSQTIQMPSGHRVVELASVGDLLFAATNMGSLLEVKNSSVNFLIGKPYQLHVTDQTLSDVLQDGQILYLAGDGWVDVYDMVERTIKNSFQLGTLESVKLLYVQDGMPVSFSGGKVFLGDLIIDGGAGAVLGVTRGGTHLWTVRDNGGGAYIKAYSLTTVTGNEGALCFFRAANVPGVQQVYDARQLPNGSVAVSTDSGLYLYSPVARSWIPAPVDAPSGPLRLYVTNKYLLIVSAFLDESTAYQVVMVPLDSINLPDSCSQLPAGWESQSDTVRAISVDEAHGEMLSVSRNGDVTRWQDGNVSMIQDLGSKGPFMGDLRRFYNNGNNWFFASNSTVWSYDINLHQWKRYDVSLSSGALPMEINLEWPDNKMVVIASDGQGSFYSSEFTPPFPANLHLDLAYEPNANDKELDPSSLLDAGTYGGNLWGFLLQDRVLLYNPAERSWEDEFTFLNRDPSRAWGRLLGIDIIQSDNGQRLWINKSVNALDFIPYTLNSGETTAIDSSRIIWRYTQDGNILRCEMADVDYLCGKALPSPFLLNSQHVSQFFSKNSLHWFLFNDSLRIYDPSVQQEVFLPGYGERLQGLHWVRSSKDGLFIYHPGELLYSANDNPQLKSVQATVVDRVIFDSTQTVWSRVLDGWKVFVNGSFHVPEGDLAQVFAFEGGIPAALNRQNQLLRWENGKFISNNLSLPADVDPTAIIGLIPQSDNNWWVVEQTRILFLRDTLCQAGRCLVVDKISNLPVGLAFLYSDDIAGIQLVTSGMDIFHQNGLVAKVQLLTDGSLSISAGTGTPILGGTIINEWSTYSSSVAKLPNGLEAFDPVVEINTSPDGKLIARRSSGGGVILADKGALISSIASLPALDSGWLQWNRTDKTFSVATSQGKISLRPDEFVRNGKFLFEPVDAFLVVKGGQYLAANSSGVWAYKTKGLGVDDVSIQFTRVDLTGRITAAHGRFYSNNGELIAGQSKVNNSLTRIEASFGDVVIQEDPAARIGVWLRDGSNILPAMAEFGFLWDSNLVGIAHSTRNVLIQSDAGVLTQKDYDLVLPSSSSLFAGELLESENGLAFLGGEKWYGFSGNSWHQQNNPKNNRLLVDNATWKWMLQNGQLSVELKNNPNQFQLLMGNGLAFTSDLLKTAGALNGQILVLTNAFLEVATVPEELGNFSAVRSSSFPAVTFMQAHDEKGDLPLYMIQNNKVSLWDSTKKNFIAAPIDPRTSGALAVSPALQFTRSGNNVNKGVMTRDASGVSRLMPFYFGQDRFPFDFILSVSAFENQIYLGTLAGLELYNLGSPGIASIQLVNTNSNMNGPLSPVTSVGSPLTNKALLMVKTENNCVERTSGSANYKNCSSPDAINARYRLDNGFWQWTKTGGQAAGYYRNALGVLTGPAIESLNGGFPHDQIQEAISCGQQTMSLWANGWVTAHPIKDMRIKSGILNYSVLPLLPGKFVCLSLPLDQNGTYLSSGTYLQSSDGSSFAFYDQKNWHPITGSLEVKNLLEQIQSPVYYETARLRLRNNQDGLMLFEYKTDNKDWLELPWEDGRVSLDRWKRILFLDNSLWAVSPVGLVSYQLSLGGTAHLDPVIASIVKMPMVEGAQCDVTDLKESKGDVWLRCSANSQSVFSGRLISGKDQSNFSLKQKEDPFVAETLVTQEQSGFWSWNLKGRANGSKGEVEVFFGTTPLKEELVSLFNGQWGFDGIQSLAFDELGWAEMAGQISGWYRAPLSDLHLKNWVRQTDWPDLQPANIAWVGMSRTDGVMSFCLRSNDGQYARVVTGTLEQNITSCADFQAEEGMWQYDIVEGRLDIFGSNSAAQNITRILRDGRFADDIVYGPPVTYKDGENVFYLLPTNAGVIQFKKDNERLNLIKFGEGYIDSEVKVLSVLAETGPVFYKSGQLFSIDESDGPPVMSLQVPDVGEIKSIDDGPFSYLRVWVTSIDQTGWFLIDKNTGIASPENFLPVLIYEFSVYRENALQWGAFPYLMTLTDVDKVSFMKTTTEPPISEELGKDFNLIVSIPVGNQMIIIGRKNILVANLSLAVRELLR